MKNCFLYSKAGKEIVQICQDENQHNFVAALQTLRDKLRFVGEQLNDEQELQMIRLQNSTFIIRDLKVADLILEIQALPIFAQIYTDLVEMLIYSVLSKKFIQVLEKQPNADLSEQFKEQKAVLQSILKNIGKLPCNFIAHYFKLKNVIDYDRIFQNQEICALIYNSVSIVQLFVRENIDLKEFGKSNEETFLQVSALHQVCLQQQKQVCISSIAPTAMMQIQYFNLKNGQKLAIISGTQEQTREIMYFDDLEVEPALNIAKINIPQRINGIAIINQATKRAAMYGTFDIPTLERIVQASSEQSAVILDAGQLCYTTWINGEYCISIQSEKNELVWGQNNQDSIMRVAYEYFAFRSWFVKE